MRDQYFYGHGKLLLTGEYFVMEGAEALALPTTVGQSMKVKYRQSYQPVLNWKSYDHTGKIWFESDLEFWHFRPIKESDASDEKVQFLSDVLKACRLQNPHFLRDDVDVLVETRIEFPLGWGLGSSSTFLYNIAQWAYVSPFELLKKTLGGSGYDIACAQALGPVIFKNIDQKPQWESCDFNPTFKDKLYFVYLEKKQSSKLEVQRFHKMDIPGKSLIVDEISLITKEMISTNDLRTFNKLLAAHEDIIATSLNYEKVKDLYFSDYWGEVKSLGAWGGDFILVTSDRDPQETREYFKGKGFETLIAYNEIVRSVAQEL